MIRCTKLYLSHKNILRKNIKEIYPVWTMLHAQLPETGVMYSQSFPDIAFCPCAFSLHNFTQITPMRLPSLKLEFRDIYSHVTRSITSLV